MSEMNENFEAMLAESFKTLNTGDIVTGTVTYVTDAEIQLDVGAQVTGIIKAEQITDDPSVKLTELYKKGDQIEGRVGRVSDIEGIAELSKKAVDSARNWQKIVAANEEGAVVTGKVVEVIKGGVNVLVGANRVFVFTSFGLFTDGFAKFDDYYANGYIDRIVTTNLIYGKEDLKSREWYQSVNMCKYVAYLIDTLNHDATISNLLNPAKRVHKLIDKHAQKLAEKDD